MAFFHGFYCCLVCFVDFLLQVSNICLSSRDYTFLMNNLSVICRFLPGEMYFSGGWVGTGGDRN